MPASNHAVVRKVRRRYLLKGQLLGGLIYLLILERLVRQLFDVSYLLGHIDEHFGLGLYSGAYLLSLLVKLDWVRLCAGRLATQSES